MNQRSERPLILGVSASHHDTSAVLLRGREVMAALEEERANRVKHTNAFPVEAIRFCLQEAGVSFFDVDRICLNVAEEFVVRRIAEQASSQIVPTSLTPRSQVVQRFRSAGLDLDPVKLRFVPHHVAHAASAWFLSGLTEALVVSLDGVGDDSELDTASGIIFTANDSGMKRL